MLIFTVAALLLLGTIILLLLLLLLDISALEAPSGFALESLFSLLWTRDGDLFTLSGDDREVALADDAEDGRALLDFA